MVITSDTATLHSILFKWTTIRRFELQINNGILHSFNVALNFENDQIAQLNSIPKLYQWHVKLTKSKDLCKMSSTDNKSFISGGAMVLLKELYISVHLCYFVVKLGKSRASVNNYLLNYSLFQLKSFPFRLQKLHASLVLH